MARNEPHVVFGQLVQDQGDEAVTRDPQEGLHEGRAAGHGRRLGIVPVPCSPDQGPLAAEQGVRPSE